MAQRGSTAGVIALLIGCGLVLLVGGGAALLYLFVGGEASLPAPARPAATTPEPAEPRVSDAEGGGEAIAATAALEAPTERTALQDEADSEVLAALNREIARLQAAWQRQHAEMALMIERMAQLEARVTEQELSIPELVREQLPQVAQRIETQRAHQAQVSALTARLDNLRGVLPEITDDQILTVKTVMQDYYQWAYDIRGSGQDISLVNARLDEARRQAEARMQAALGEDAYQQARARGVIHLP